eukprot:GEMP01011232.1.p1 GENE.GEMP01011232.1~~GEMP01011232.1.p1  ORF type:complete len:641 (+),score=129.46 GEMP01011232.1:545-2467(+)
MACCSRCSASRSFYGQPKKAAYISCNVTYPMYCVPLTVALEMDAVESHEALLARGVLVQHKLGDVVPVIFVSHQWVSNEHPDPDFTQFAVLQGAIRRMLAGYEVRSDWFLSIMALKDIVVGSWPLLLQNALVWYDYFSVPQAASNREAFQHAVKSIPAYIEMSAMTFILAPTVDHHEAVDANGEASVCDFYSWKRRGWCRLELLAAHLKVNSQPPVVIRSEAYMHFIPIGILAIQARVAEGDFTCCALNHQRIHPDGTASPLTCDKAALFGVVRTLIENRLQYERKRNNLRFVRKLLALRHACLRDLRPTEESDHSLDFTLSEFLTKYEFASPREFDGGWTPLRFACISGNANIARQLIDEKADIEANLKAPCEDTGMEKGSNILTQIITLCCCLEHENVLDLLVTRNANLCSSQHMDALAWASSSQSSSKRGARWFFRTFAEWNVNNESCGPDGLIRRRALPTSVICTADLDYVRTLGALKADFTWREWPLSNNVFQQACSMCPTSSPDITRYILHELQKSQAEDDTPGAISIDTQLVHECVNRRLTTPFVLRMMLKLARMSKWGPTTYMDFVLFRMGSTALLGAASEGKHRVCKWLIEQKADTSIANADGETPLSIAQKRGFTRVVDVLCSTSAHERV